ncbi:MAG: hypothetical protein HXY40_12955 [Chloroflexi bacterium]|nr:hypothetical protein [Chloroflexota bacterium]
MPKNPVRLCFLFCLLLAVSAAAAQESTPEPEYVIATHYPDFGGTQPAPRDEIRASYGVYNNRLNDYEAVDAAAAAAIRQEISAGILGREVLLLNSWNEVQQDIEALQIVNNVPLEGALYTIFLPPGWNNGKDLPIVLSGNGAGTSNNRRLYTGGETDMGLIIGLSTAFGGEGIIGAMSNCGGTESQGVDEPTYRSVGAFLDFLDEHGGNKYNVMTAGWSRGGGSALMWAINPLQLDYEVHTVFAGVPPVRYGALALVTPLTYPSMGSIGVLIGQDENAYRYDNDGWRPGANPSPFLEVILGTNDPAEADRLGPWGMAEGLRGKNIMLEAGSHDAFFSLRFVLEYDRLLTEMGIAHGTVITLNSGHEDTDLMRDMLTDALLAMSRGQEFTTPTGRFYAIDINPLEDEEMPLDDYYTQQGIQDDPTQLPVTAEFPFRIGAGNPADITVCGTPGDVVALRLGDVYALEVTIDANECYSEQVNFDFPVGMYFWQLTVNGETIEADNTPGFSSDNFPLDALYGGYALLQGCSLVAVTFVEADQPLWSESYATRRTMSYGMLQYAPAVRPGNCTIG